MFKTWENTSKRQRFLCRCVAEYILNMSNRSEYVSLGSEYVSFGSEYVHAGSEYVSEYVHLVLNEENQSE